MEIDFRKLIGVNYDELLDDVLAHKHTHYTLMGGRGSLKSSFVALVVILLIIKFKNIHAVVIRKVGNTLRDSVFAQYCWAIEKLGLVERFEFLVSPMRIRYKKTGQLILFRGADKKEKIKSIKVPFGYIGITHFEEVDQMTGRAEIRNILQSTMRGGDIFYNFESFNPPRAKSNWANADISTERIDRLVHKSCYLDAPREWLGEQFFFEAEELKSQNEMAYRNEYLGEAIGNGANVFENVEQRTITDDEINLFDHIRMGLDWGYFPDPFQFVKMHFDSQRRILYIFDEYRTWKASNLATFEMLTKIKNVALNDVIIADSAEKKSIADYREYGLVNCRGALKGAGSVEYSIKWLQSLNKIVIDGRRCPYAIKEFSNYEYKKTERGEFVSSYVDKDNHAIDAVRYGLEPIWRRRGE